MWNPSTGQVYMGGRQSKSDADIARLEQLIKKANPRSANKAGSETSKDRRAETEAKQKDFTRRNDENSDLD